LLPPDREALAQVGLLYEWQDPGVDTFQIWGAETEITTRPTADDAEACLSTRIRRIVGVEFEDTRYCAPGGLSLCADARPLDSADWQPYASADAESDGCQASPGAAGVPLAAGLFALLLGLGRRRRS
jgi:MYXO-CTERM domain-containing protein